MRKLTCGCGTTVRGESDDALLTLAERHIATEHQHVAAATRRDDLLALAEDDPAPAAFGRDVVEA